MVTSQDDLFDEFVDSLMREFFKREPFTATFLGLHQYDRLVPDLSRDAVLEVTGLVRGYVRRLEGIDPSALSGERVVDYPVILNWLKAMLIRLEGWPTWEFFPVGIPSLGEALFPLLINESLPEEHRVEALKSRLRQVDRFVLASVRAVSKPYALWLGYALAVGKGSLTLLESVRALARRVGDAELEEAVVKAGERVNAALKEVEALTSKAEPGFRPIGKELFTELLKLEFIEESPEELRRVGYEEARKYRSLMESAARRAGAGNVEEGLRMLSNARISDDVNEYFRKYGELVARVREFVMREGVVELPEGERVRIIETPEYLRPVIPFAAYTPPETFSPSLTGTYLLTPPPTPESLASRNYYDALNTIVHEAYPGHHTQLVIAKLAAKHPRRALFANATDLVEGWAHYCEELMLEAGMEGSPLYELKVWHDALWRAVRVYLDVELHTMNLSYEEGVAKLAKDALLPEDGAKGEVLRYTLNPTYQLMYNYGKRKIKALREEVKRILGPRFSNALFHKLLLEEGGLPTNILAKIVLRKARELVNQAT